MTTIQTNETALDISRSQINNEDGISLSSSTSLAISDICHEITELAEFEERIHDNKILPLPQSSGIANEIHVTGSSDIKVGQHTIYNGPVYFMPSANDSQINNERQEQFVGESNYTNHTNVNDDIPSSENFELRLFHPNLRKHIIMGGIVLSLVFVIGLIAVLLTYFYASRTE